MRRVEETPQAPGGPLAESRKAVGTCSLSLKILSLLVNELKAENKEATRAVPALLPIKLR